jgi:dihydroorotase
LNDPLRRQELMKLHIKNGRLIDPANGIDAQQDVRRRRQDRRRRPGPGRLRGQQDHRRHRPDRAPGLVDLSARLREPGYEYKATLNPNAGRHPGGVTSLVCPPDTDPVLDEPGLVEMLKHRARS